MSFFLFLSLSLSVFVGPDLRRPMAISAIPFVIIVITK